ncbi:hypothetical protein HDU76_001945 [Blyttiomyces sp. JEL0837]|nr:hypothetical protein HDU76_001945 [Blyttiomyces sp. JEL0837]
MYRRRKHASYKNLDLENARNRALVANTSAFTHKLMSKKANMNIASTNQITRASRFERNGTGNFQKTEGVVKEDTVKSESSTNSSEDRSFNKLMDHGNEVTEFGRTDSVVSVGGVKVWKPVLKRNGGGIV